MNNKLYNLGDPMGPYRYSSMWFWRPIIKATGALVVVMGLIFFIVGGFIFWIPKMTKIVMGYSFIIEQPISADVDGPTYYGNFIDTGYLVNQIDVK